MTIYDIAELAGVSASTVSRALNGKPGVSRRNREKISRVLKEHQYVPAEGIRGLMMVSTGVVGILTDDISSDHQNEAVAYCQNELMTRGYQCFSKYIGTESDNVERAIAELGARRVNAAMLIGNTFKDHGRLRGVIEKYLPEAPVLLVYQNERIDLDNVYCVGADEQKGFHLCVEKMVKMGRASLVLAIEQGRAGEKSIRAHFEEAVKDFQGVKYAVYTGIERSLAGGRALAGRILAEHPETDGILCVRDDVAIGLMYGLQDLGKRIPEDISVIGEDNSPLCEVSRPPLTSLDTMVRLSVMMSVRMLVDMLEGLPQTHQVTLDMELAERGSL